MSEGKVTASGERQSPIAECERCGATCRVGAGLCLNCLLQRGLESEADGAETLDQILEEVEVRDTDWCLGNYQILEEIGRGGMGVIYRARQRHSRRVVALKRILSFHADSRETLVRFRREAEAAASLDHPNILPIYEVSESDDGLPYFSMKFATGGSVLAAAASLRRDPRRVVELLAKVTRAVQHAHARGILHRDIKPGNILLDSCGEPFVSDFGLAKWLEVSSDLTRTLTIFGTPGYIAPEQAEGRSKDLTATADIYSIGALLFDLLTGRPPFLGEHALAVVKQASDGPAPKLRLLLPTADRDLETICARCLEREPHLRYHSAGDLADDLERWLDGRPVLARPISPPTRAWRWSKRNRKLAISISASVVLAAAASLWLAESRHLAATVLEAQLRARSIAVLPFLDLDGAHSDTSRAARIADLLQGELSRHAPARVAALANAPAWLSGARDAREIREASGELKSRAVLSGCTRMANGQLRLSVRLINPANGEILFSRVMEGPPGTVELALVKLVAPAFDGILDANDWSQIALTGQDPAMRDPAAREFLVSGRQLVVRGTLEDFDASARCLTRAIAIQPKSALAHAYLSGTQAARVHFVPDAAIMRAAEEEAREALRLQPDLPEGHRSLAGAFLQRDEFNEVLEEQLRAVEAGGPDERTVKFIGWTLAMLGRPGRALEWLEIAKHWTSSPGSQDALIGDCLSLLDEDERAEVSYQRAIDLQPEQPDGWLGLCYLRLRQGDVDGARQVYEQNRARFETYAGVFYDNPPTEMLARILFYARDYKAAEGMYAELAAKHTGYGLASYGAMSYATALARCRQALGDAAGAESVLQECLAAELAHNSNPRAPAPLYRLAALEALLGHSDEALRYLQSAVTAGWIDHRSLERDPRFDAISADPRFRAILSTIATNVAELRRH